MRLPVWLEDLALEVDPLLDPGLAPRDHPMVKSGDLGVDEVGMVGEEMLMEFGLDPNHIDPSAYLRARRMAISGAIEFDDIPATAKGIQRRSRRGHFGASSPYQQVAG